MTQPHWIMGEDKEYNQSNGGETSWKMKISVFWVAMPCSLVVHYQCFRGNCCLNLQCTAQKTEAIGFSEMLVMIYQIMLHHLQKDSRLHRLHCSEILKLYSWKITWNSHRIREQLKEMIIRMGVDGTGLRSCLMGDFGISDQEPRCFTSCVVS